MAERIYNLTGHGVDSTLDPFEEEPFDQEDALQGLIARRPELLAGEQMNPSDPPRFILISREVGIADQADGTARWSLDHALIDQHAVPTLVETKRGDNRELRRTIVGQMLDYAAHASKYWTVAELREQFEEDEDADQRLAELLEDDDPDQEDFWNHVETNLTARNLRLLFVADQIPDELATVVEFLNEQMPRIEVLAVEIKQFRGDNGLILVPRVLGRTDPAQRRSSKRRQNLNRESFLGAFPAFQARETAECLLDTAEANGAILQYGSAAVTIRIRTGGWESSQPVTVAWIDPEPGHVGWNGTRDFTFGSAMPQYEQVPTSIAMGMRLDEWSDEFGADAFTHRVKSDHMNAWWMSHEDAAAHIETLKQRLESVLEDLAKL